ncbi:hypothetical protein [Yinghuangia sp. YIM S10712]|uniref:hypothetical protein n=1 Tax=Yinghuangia sp. YIM S10712 TaxID=3436930 RepID=UPI003F530941
MPGVTDQCLGADAAGFGVPDGTPHVVIGLHQFVERVRHALPPQAGATVGEDAYVDARAVGKGQQVDEDAEGGVTDPGILEDVVAEHAERARTPGKLNSH